MHVRAVAKAGDVADWTVSERLQAEPQPAPGHAFLPWPDATHAWHPGKLYGELHMLKGATAKKVKSREKEVSNKCQNSCKRKQREGIVMKEETATI